MPESHAAAAIPQAEGEVGADVGPDCPAGQYQIIFGSGQETRV